jgi:hypothetical protein
LLPAAGLSSGSRSSGSAGGLFSASSALEGAYGFQEDEDEFGSMDDAGALAKGIERSLRDKYVIAGQGVLCFFGLRLSLVRSSRRPKRKRDLMCV